MPGVSDEPAALWDLLPTLADFTGVALEGEVDGVSLRSLLEGQGSLPERPFYWETFNARADYLQAARQGRYKALRRLSDDHVELYDLQSDPTESNDLSGSIELCDELVELKAILNTARTPPPGDPEGQFEIDPLPAVCDAAVLFSDGFESGDLTAWSGHD